MMGESPALTARAVLRVPLVAPRAALPHRVKLPLPPLPAIDLTLSLLPMVMSEAASVAPTTMMATLMTLFVKLNNYVI